MKIGMNMLLWTDHFTSRHYGIIDQLKEVGYQGIEIPLGKGDSTHYTSIGNQLSGNEMEVTCVTSLHEDTNIASPNLSVRSAGLDRLKWAIDMAHAATAEVICGPFHSAFAYFTRLPPTSDEKKWSIEMLHKAGEYAQQTGIVLALGAGSRLDAR